MAYLLHVTLPTGQLRTLTCPSAFVRGLWVISLAAHPAVTCTNGRSGVGMRCTYRKRFVPDATIRARMDARDERFMLDQRRQFPHLFPPTPVVEVALVPDPEAVGPVVDVALVPVKIDGAK